MNNAQLYHVANGLQRSDSEDLIKEYREKIAEHCTSGCEVMDVGCGDGYVTVEILKKYMPGLKTLVGCDISREMVEFASSTFRNKDVSFTVMDIEDANVAKQFESRFQMVTSFYCLHWARNLGLSMRNIYQMVKRDGGCLLLFPVVHPVFDAYNVMMLDPRWKDLTKDTRNFIPKLSLLKSPQEECHRLMKASGFKDIQVEIQGRQYSYDGLKEFKSFVASVNPFMKHLPEMEALVYLDKLVNVMFSLPTVSLAYGNQENILAITTEYKTVAIYAKK